MPSAVITTTSPAGSNQQLQFNNSGAFGANSNLIWDGTNISITGGQLLIPTTAKGVVFATNFTVYSNGSGQQLVFNVSGTNYVNISNSGNGTINLRNSGRFSWDSTADPNNLTPDAGLARNAPGVVEVNNGTAGTFRDLKVRNPIVTGNVLDTNANTLLGVTATASAVNSITLANAATTANPTLSASGTDTNIGINLTPKGTGNVVITNTGLSIPTNAQGVQFGGGTGFTLYSQNSGGRIFLNQSSTNYFMFSSDANGTVNFRNSVRLTWDSSTDAGNVTPDTGFARNAAGVVEVNSGTVGTFKDLKARSVIHAGVTVANLPTGPTAGQVAYVTDGAAALAWGATVTGGASTPYLVWYNGTNWTVAGK